MKEGKYKMGKNPWVSFDKLTDFEIKPDAIPPTLDGGLRKSLM